MKSMNPLMPINEINGIILLINGTLKITKI
jgi:hypothetical protein